MSMAERAELVARLSLKDDFSGKLRGVEGGFKSSMGRMGATAVRGVGTAAVNIAKLGVLGAAGIAAAVKGGIDSLAELESATTSVDGAIKQMGLTGQITAQQVAAWGQKIETAVGSAFDDKAITQAATTLIRFGKITPQNLEPAMQVMTDLATKTGDVDSAASLLAKALADPEKAAGKLARSGVILTKVQQDQIKAMVKTGDMAGAQKLLLDALSKATTGAALASQGPYARSQKVLRDVTEDAQRALATGFLPVIERVRAILTKVLADPKTLAGIKEFGQGIASGLDQLVTTAEGVDWASIGNSLKTAGEGARTVIGLFTSAPDWVKTAVLTGWGLNKLSGGALGDIFGQGIKLTFGQFFQRGASPANPMWVQSVAGGIGGPPAGAPVPAGGPGLLPEAGFFGGVSASSLAAGFATAFIPVLAAELVLATSTAAQRQVSSFTARQETAAARGINPTNVPFGGQGGERSSPLAAWVAAGTALGAKLNKSGSPDERDALNTSRAQKTALDRIRDNAETNRIRLVSAQQSAADRIVSAIHAAKPVVSVSVNVSNRVTTYQTGTTLTSTKARILESMAY